MKPNLNNLSKEVFEAPILHLNLMGEYYDAIESGFKKEEYREQKEFWNRVFTQSGTIKIKKKLYHPTDVIVCFSNGFAKDRRQMYWTLKRLHSGFGQTEWGAKEGIEYHILSLDKNVTRAYKHGKLY